MRVSERERGRMADDSELLIRLREITQQPLEERAVLFVELHESLQRSLEDGDAADLHA